MGLETELQLETLLQRVFTLNYTPRIVKDSYMALFLKMAVLVFALFALRLMLVSGSLSFIALLAALLAGVVATLVTLSLLSLLRSAYGARGVLIFSAVLLLMAVIIILI